MGQVIAIKIVWSKRTYDWRPQSSDTVDKVIKDFVEAHLNDLIDEVQFFQLQRLATDARPIDAKLSLERNGIIDGDTLLLTRSPPHHQTRWDDAVAALLVIYTIFFFLTALLVLLAVWPQTSKQLALNSTRTLNVTISYLNSIPYLQGIPGHYTIGPEVLLMIVMILSGTVGACAYSLYAISDHLGQREDFNRSFTAWYLTRPMLGGGIAFALYLLVRSGLFTLGTQVSSLNLIGLAGISIIAGLFTEQVLVKLNELIDTLFGASKTQGSKKKSSSDSGKP